MLVCCSIVAIAQPTVLGTQAQNGSYSTYNLADLGIFRQVRMQATSSGISGTRNWEFCEGTAASPDYDPAWRPYSCCLTLAFNQTIIPFGGTASALKNLGFGGSSGYLPAITSGNYYTFNCTESSTPGVPLDEYMGVLETAYNPVSITSVVQTPGIGAVYPENSVYVTITLSGTLSASEYVYLRYSTTVNFASSTFMSVPITGTIGTVEIPCQAAGTTIYYYAYTSNKTYAAINTEVGTYGQVVHDMNTLSINNNGGPNYIYTVLPSVGFCGNYYVPSVCYPTIASFVNALNGGTVSCSVICNVAAGHTETAPVGGINLTQTGTAANNITFIKNGVGANPLINAWVGTTTLAAGMTTPDGVFSLNGSDYITIDGIDITDNNATAPGTMEFGYALYKVSGTNGSRNNTIRNCVITLKNSNFFTSTPVNFEFGSVGVMVRNSTRTAANILLTVSSAAGRNDNNSFYGNTISGAYNGFVLAGCNDGVSPYTFYDQNNSVGIVGNGNIINNYGNLSGTVRSSGVFSIYNNNLTISDNNINNSLGGTASGFTLYGIFVSSPITVTNYLQSISVSNNTISLLEAAVTSQVTGIKLGNSNIGATNINITGNTIQNCTFTAGASGLFIGIEQEFDATSNQIINNTISNNTFNTTTTSPIYLIHDDNNSTTSTVSGNVMNNNLKTTNVAGALYGYVNNTGGSTVGSSISITNNSIDNLTVNNLSTGYVSGIFCNFTNLNAVKTVSDNSVSNIVAGSGTTNWSSGIMVNNMPAGSIVSNNTVNNISSTSNVIGINCASNASISTSLNQSFSVSDNDVSAISSTGNSANIAGIAIYSLTNVDCNNNNIDNITASGTSPAQIKGLNLGGGSVGNIINVSFCNISNVSHTNVAGITNPVGIYLFPNSATLNIFNNNINEISGSASDFVIGIYGTSGTTTYNIYNNFIQRLYAPNSTNNTAVNGIYVAAGGNTYNVFYNTIALGQNGVISGGSGFGVCGFYHGAGLLNLRNNIIYVNANPVGLGVASCLRKPTPGTAGTPPATTSISATSDNNFYYLNTGLNNYIYVEGLTTSTIKNGYAYSGATTSVPNNLNNDPCFNILTASDIMSYKYFMSLGGGGNRELNSLYDIPNFAGGAILPDNLKILVGSPDYAESHAVNIATPLITTDYEGTIRQGNPGYSGTGTAPDIGADEGEFVLAPPECLLLPIELLSFTGWYNGEENELHWTTASEINSDFFEVQKSTDGINFYIMGNVDAAGYSNAELNYLFYDDDPIAGINYYKLRMVDFNGDYEYSNTIAIRVDIDADPAFVIFPNPVHDNLNFSIISNDDSKINIKITDVLGRNLLTQEFTLHSGQNTFSLPIEKFASATYLIYYFDKSGAKQVQQFVKF
ncbi:MAG: T9SS type A sorting domain-containing protein [Bacteroidetes bacterium]|nr:T9SS type A sorting domain-containing protein [Bacteroidota bacterium]